MTRLVFHLLVCAALFPAIVAHAQEKAGEKDRVTISIFAFDEMVNGAARTCEALALDGKTISAKDRLELKIPIPSRVLKLWMDVVPELEANVNPPRAHEDLFPPALANVLAKQPEVKVDGAHIFEAIGAMRKLALAVSKPGAGAPVVPEAPPVLTERTIDLPRKWIDELFVERERLTQKNFDADERRRDPAVVLVEKREDGRYVRLPGATTEKMTVATVPDEGPVYCAPFGKGGTWNLYQLIGRPATWLEAEAAAQKLPVPFGAGKVTGHLASLQSRDENAFAVRLGEGTRYIWIGLNDRRIESWRQKNGPWEWSSGEPVAWRNWYFNEPDCGRAGPVVEFDKSFTDEDGVACVGSLRSEMLGRWADFGGGVQPQNARRNTYLVEWNVDAPAPIAGAKQLAPAFPADLEGPAGADGSFGVRIAYEGNSCTTLAVALEHYRSGAGRIVNAQLATIHHFDPDTLDIRALQGEPAPWPGQTPGLDANTAVLCRGRIRVPEAGTYTFNVHHDDGIALRIKGAKWKSAHGDAVVDVADPTALVSYWSTTYFASSRGVIDLSAGDHEIEFFGFQAAGRFYFDLAAARGEFPEEADTDMWRLVGQPARGKLGIPGLTKEGWTVTALTHDALQAAMPEDEEKEIDTPDLVVKRNVAAVNFRDPDYTWALYGDAPPFPRSIPDVDDNKFALRAKGTLEIPVDGLYWIGFHATCTGSLKIAGQTWKRILRCNPKTEIDGDELQSFDQNDWSHYALGEIELKAGKYAIEALTAQFTGRAGFAVVGGPAGEPQVVLKAGAARVIDDAGGLQLVK